MIIKLQKKIAKAAVSRYRFLFAKKHKNTTDGLIAFLKDWLRANTPRAHMAMMYAKIP